MSTYEPFPESLVLVRHGESESNYAKSAFEQGISVPAEPELMRVHTSERRLTPLGIEQAKQAGAWLRENWMKPSVPANMYRNFVSPYVRARETAGHLQLGARWQTDSRLVERNWGSFDQMPYSERSRQFAEELELRKEYAFFWEPPNGGEAFQGVFNRLEHFKSRLRRSPARKVVVVCHGETMWVFRKLFEYMTPQDLRDAMLQQDDATRIHNCRIIEYSCIDENGELQPRFRRVRFIDPSNPDNPATNTDWRPVARQFWSDEELLAHVDEYPQFINLQAAE